MANRLAIFSFSTFYQLFFGVISFADTPGLVDQAPKDVRSVKTDRGYMIPYKVELSDKVSFEMIPIPGGKFKLGSPDSEKGRKSDEGPQVEVEISPFWLGKCEVTWSEYREYISFGVAFSDPDGIRAIKVTEANKVDAVTCPSQLYAMENFTSYGSGDLLPAVMMTQFSARQYTKWLSKRTELSYRLPNEAEWEYACRSGSVTAYCYGDDPSKLSEYAWTKENGDGTDHQVGQKKPNSWGLHDMHGNVMEWTLDAYTKDRYSSLTDKYKKIQMDERKKMIGLGLTEWPKKFYSRILRGGCVFQTAEQARSAARYSDNKEWHDTDPERPKSPMWYRDELSIASGFRILRPLESMTKDELARCWDADEDQTKEAVDVRLNRGRISMGIPAPIKAKATVNKQNGHEQIEHKTK